MRVFGCVRTWILLMNVICWGSAVIAQEGQYQLFWGDNMQSRYSVVKEGQEQKMSPQIFDAYGKPRAEAGQLIVGSVVQNKNFGASNEPAWAAGPWEVADGFAWTPRVESLNGFDLTSESKLTDQSGFNFTAFERHPAVIRFANGYAVNLFGTRVKDNSVIGPGKEGTYLSSSGDKLVPRLITRLNASRRPIRKGDPIVTTVQAPLMDSTETRAVVPAGAKLLASDVTDQWVAVTVNQAGRTITGWISRQNLALAGAQFEERLLK